jgi:peptide subunit release factor 1 (eRF1)
LSENKRSSLELYRLKRLVEELESKEGKATELVSLYVPPGRQISDAMNNLREEYGTAANIKSKSTRKNVQEAIESSSGLLRRTGWLYSAARSREGDRGQRRSKPM